MAQHGNVLGVSGWATVIGALTALFDSRLLPSSMTELEDFVATNRRITWNSTSKTVVRKDTNSFFFSFSAYLYAETEQAEDLDTASPAFTNAAASIQRFNLPELLSDSGSGSRTARGPARAGGSHRRGPVSFALAFRWRRVRPSAGFFSKSRCWPSWPRWPPRANAPPLSPIARSGWPLRHLRCLGPAPRQPSASVGGPH